MPIVQIDYAQNPRKDTLRCARYHEPVQTLVEPVGSKMRPQGFGREGMMFGLTIMQFGRANMAIGLNCVLARVWGLFGPGHSRFGRA